MRKTINRLFCGIAGLLYSKVSARALPLTPEDLAAMRVSFSQFGEDLVVAGCLLGMRRSRGIYVDAGCFHPFRFSNTRLLNLMGWRGINVDASESSIEAFRKARPADYNVCAALSDRAGQNEFIHTVSGASSRLARGAAPLPQGFAITSRRHVTTTTLQSVLDASPYAAEQVDFLDIDCEGADLAVLRGFVLDRRKPLVLCIESHGAAEQEEIRAYLAGYGYEQISSLGPSVIYRSTAAQS